MSLLLHALQQQSPPSTHAPEPPLVGLLGEAFDLVLPISFDPAD